MVEFLKAKGTSFVNKPVGVNNVNTGAVEAGQTLARVGQQLATQFFADAEQEQIKLGKEVGMTLPVRDGDGNLSFQTTPTTLSDVAKNAAEPIIQKRYEDALNVDIFGKLNEIRQKSRTSGEFSKNVENEMSVYIEQTKQSGGDRYVGGMTESIAKLSAQHFNAMATEETKEAMRISSLQHNMIDNKNIADLISIAGDRINKANIGELLNVLEDLDDNSLAILERNDQNLAINNLAVDTHRKTATSAKTAVTFAMINILTKDKTSAQILDIENYFRTGTVPTHLNDKEKALLNQIEDSPFRNEVEKYLSGVQDKVNETQNRLVADQNRQKVINADEIKKYKSNPEIFYASQDYKAKFMMDLRTEYLNIYNNGGVASDEQKAKIRALETQIFSTTNDTGMMIGGKRIMLSRSEVMTALNESVV